jgi:nicotinate-nucleotide adenylyltransferase
MIKIALFGTSADPPTAAHKSILKWLSSEYDWVAVWAADNPFKQHKSSLKHRLEMLRLLLQEIDQCRANIKVYEQLSHPWSLTSIQEAKKIWGESPEYSLVIGSDLVKQIRQWHCVEELLKEVKILIIPRPGYPFKKDDLKSLQNLGGEYQIAGLNAPAISSSSYREQGDSTVLTPSIEAYISQQKLYP